MPILKIWPRVSIHLDEFNPNLHEFLRSAVFWVSYVFLKNARKFVYAHLGVGSDVPPKS